MPSPPKLRCFFAETLAIRSELTERAAAERAEAAAACVCQLHIFVRQRWTR
jgi:hypothetical protein